MIKVDYMREKQFSIETNILIDALSLYKVNNSIEAMKDYLEDLISSKGLQSDQIDMFIRNIRDYHKKD